jgi:hypothetical protein
MTFHPFLGFENRRSDPVALWIISYLEAASIQQDLPAFRFTGPNEAFDLSFCCGGDDRSAVPGKWLDSAWQLKYDKNRKIVQIGILRKPIPNLESFSSLKQLGDPFLTSPYRDDHTQSHASITS